MNNEEEVFDVDTIRSLGLEYKEGTIKTLNKTGYMRNYLSDISRKFCSQKISKKDTLVEIGCGIGTVLYRLILNGARNVVGVDPEIRHLEIGLRLLKPVLDQRDVKLRMICDSLPHLSSLEDKSIRSALCSQVLHYMKPEEFDVALKRLYQLLKDGGTLYITVGSPYYEVYKGFGDVYEDRLRKHDRFPGYMEDVRRYHPSGENLNPGFFLFFDPLVLAERVCEAGFKVLKASYVDVARYKRGQTGLIAIKNKVTS